MLRLSLHASSSSVLAYSSLSIMFSSCFPFISPSPLRLLFFFFFNDPAPTEISPLSLHDALPISEKVALVNEEAWEAHNRAVYAWSIAEARRRQMGGAGGRFRVLPQEQPVPPVNPTPKLVMTALLHDAAEAYLGDMVRPLKHDAVLGKAYLEAEVKIEQAISLRFDLDYPFEQ